MTIVFEYTEFDEDVKMDNWNNRIEEMVLQVMDALLCRFESKRAQGVIDTKFDLVTGNDFGAGDAWYKQSEIIFSWIQGRGLESFAGHLEFIRRTGLLSAKEKNDRIIRIKQLLREVSDNMERLRRKNHGRLFFMMRNNGKFLAMDSICQPLELAKADGNANYSDLFYSKGLFAAGAALNDRKLARRGELYLRRVITAILKEEFVTDQQMFDPKNPVLAVPGKFLQGPKMIALGGTALGITYGDAAYWERCALRLLKRIFQHHTNAQGDFWEATDAEFNPWIENGKLICDPGHALEFIGLSAKNLLLFQSPAGLRFRARCAKYYADFLRHQFNIGYDPEVGGIIKSYDLRSRQRVNSDMPWWSLPETVRAAVLTARLTGDKSLLQIARICTESFFKNYVNPKCSQMAVQTRDKNGNIAPVIPAVPDADPGYHTNLSMIDALAAFKH